MINDCTYVTMQNRLTLALYTVKSMNTALVALSSQRFFWGCKTKKVQNAGIISKNTTGCPEKVTDSQIEIALEIFGSLVFCEELKHLITWATCLDEKY